MAEQKQITRSLISQIVGRIVDRCKPQKIVMFGSRAWGEAKPDSDVDLFVVMPSKLRRDERSVEISKLFPDRLYPLDVLVYTPEELENSVRHNPFVKEIIEKGKVLHES